MENKYNKFEAFTDEQIIVAAGFAEQLNPIEVIQLRAEIRTRNLLPQVQLRFGEQTEFFRE